MTFSVLTICGSLRKASFNGMLCNSLLDLAPETLSLASAPSFAGFPLFNADLMVVEGTPDDVTALADAIRASDGVIIASPEYNYSVPGALKNAIDWLSRQENQPFKNKPIALQSTATGLLGGARVQYHLRHILQCLGANLMTGPEVFIPFARDAFDSEHGVLADETSRGFVRDQLAKFESFMGWQNSPTP